MIAGDMRARDEILARVRAATADIGSMVGDRPPVTTWDDVGSDADRTLDLFAETVADYRADVVRVDPAQVGTAVTEALLRHGCRGAVVPADLPEDWVAAVTAAGDLHVDDGRLAADDLDRIDAVVTGAALGVATTGTIILDHRSGQGRRTITLVPDTHVCVIRADQVVHDVPEAIHRMRPGSDDVPPLTWISGPSATSDIELERVEGVHGPRTLVVVLVDTDRRPTP